MQNESPLKVTSLFRGSESQNLSTRLSQSILKSKNLLFSQQYAEGFWWYTLEANESIGAEFIMLLHYLGLDKSYGSLPKDLAERILRCQRPDGSWGLFHEGSGDLSTTVECYFALRLAGFEKLAAPLMKAKDFILKHGGIIKTRVFTKIHLALFGLVPWKACPDMPVSFLLLPDWFPLNIYDFSSWARACIVPLLVVMEKKKTVSTLIDLEELFTEPPEKRNYTFSTDKGFFSWENFFIQSDRLLKSFGRLTPPHPFNRLALMKAESWISRHVEKTEDIYPALAYSVLALHALGHDLKAPMIQKCLKGLLAFQQHGKSELPALPTVAHSDPFRHRPPAAFEVSTAEKKYLHQQCCISPVWDTPWAMTALLEAGAPAEQPALLKAGRWLISKQITHTYGDWFVKNKRALPGGWSFEFENDFFPDVDDTIQVLSVLFKLELPREELTGPFQRGLDWLFSMQSKNGGWAAFDVNNTFQLVNKIPFSDHGACLDPPTPDITGRMLEFLGNIGYSLDHPSCAKALNFILQRQEKSGAWEGRWGVNYVYGTWCVLQGLAAIGIRSDEPYIVRAAQWLKSVQNSDGGWSESCESYAKRKHVPLKTSTASQTAWAVLGLIAAGEASSKEACRGIEYLMSGQTSRGGWDEEAHTGTGFPGHFYIRYHGYRHYFPLLALAKFKNTFQKN